MAYDGKTLQVFPELHLLAVVRNSEDPTGMRSPCNCFVNQLKNSEPEEKTDSACTRKVRVNKLNTYDDVVLSWNTRVPRIAQVETGEAAVNEATVSGLSGKLSEIQGA